MNKKYIVSGLIGFAAILGWNVFLIQRDQRLFSAYDHACAKIQSSHSNCIYTK